MAIVTTNAGELKYLYDVDGKEAMVVDVGDEIAIVDAVKKVISDNKLAESLSENARSKAIKYSWNTVKESWKEIINKIEI